MPRQIDPNKPLFTISSVAEILGIKPRMLRLYEERGLISPSRTDGNRRLYSIKDIDILAYFQYLTMVKKVNIAGVLEIQKILKKLDEETRNTFMSEIEKEIDKLPKDKKDAFIGDEEKIPAHVIKDAESLPIDASYKPDNEK